MPQNRRRLVTSLILVITTIILIILLIVNLDCIIFTEATVNTSTTTSTPPTIPPAPPNTTLASLVLNPSPQTQSQKSHSNHTASSTNSSSFAPVLSSQIGHSITNQSVTAKTKNSETTITGGSGSSGSDLANNTATTTDILLASATATTTNNIVTDFNELKQPLTKMSNKNATELASDNPCALPTPDRNNATLNTTKHFDIDYASRTFLESMVDANAISLHHYLNGFKELMKFFHSLGTIFLFVTSDLEAKIGLLESYRNTEKQGCNPAYLTIQSVIEYERKENLLTSTKRQSGARTILRLHRALEFLSSLMLNLSQLNEEDETAPAARDAYSKTLSNYHPWTIRTIASFAMRTLPHKNVLVESVLGKENSGNKTLVNEQMLRLANVTENLFKVVDKYYEENDIKNLP